MKGMLIHLSLLLLCSSCGGHLKLSTRGCDLGQAVFDTGDSDVIYDDSLWHKNSDGEKKVVYLKELLNEKKIECSRLKTVSYEVGQSFMDQLLSLVPFVRRSHIVIRGKY